MTEFLYHRYVDTKLKSNWESDEEEHQMTFVLRQLLILAGVFDLTDEVGRLVCKGFAKRRSAAQPPVCRKVNFKNVN